MTRGAALVLALTVCACATSRDSERISELDRRVGDFDGELAPTEADVRRLGSEWADITEQYTSAADAYRAARQRYESALAASSAATDRSRAAATAWERARTRWRLYRAVIEVALAIDMQRYRDPRGGGFSCDEMSTTAFRRLLASQGMDLTGLDVDHIVPRSLGGANHPDNYQLLDASTNRSIGNDWGLEKCESVGRDRCSRAITASTRCGSYRARWF